MSWVDRLYRRLPAIWDRDPQGVLAFTISCDGTGLTWTIADGVLTFSPVGGTASPLVIQLSAYPALHLLVTFLHAQQGYAIANYTGPPLGGLASLSLADGSGDVARAHGGDLLIAMSAQYQVLQAVGAELAAAEAQIPTLPLQMSTTTAAGSWLDFLGGFFSVPRVYREGDVAYAVRIIQETVRPKCNNVSMARALQAYTGIAAQVTDAVNYSPGTNLLNGAFALDGSHTLASGFTTTSGGLFDVEGGFDLIQGSELTDIATMLTGYINRLRAAGTQLRTLTLAPLSNLIDAAPKPNDGADTLTVAYSNTLNGAFNLDGTTILSGGLTITGSLSRS